MKKDKYIYPAIFEAEGEQYNISFPDLDIFTCGDNLEDALYMAKDLLGGYLYTLEEENKTERRNVTIPKWLNKVVKEKNINCSAVLVTALKDKLGIR